MEYTRTKGTINMFKLHFLENEGLNEKILSYIFHVTSDLLHMWNYSCPFVRTCVEGS